MVRRPTPVPARFSYGDEHVWDPSLWLIRFGVVGWQPSLQAPVVASSGSGRSFRVHRGGSAAVDFS